MAIAEVVQELTRGDVPVRVTAFDGSATGRGPVEIRIASPRGLAHMLRAPGQLGLVRAYTDGDVEISGVHPGDPYEALKLLQQWKLRAPSPQRAAALLSTLRTMGLPRDLAAAGPPPVEAPPRWRRSLVHHTPGTDALSVRHHYDVSNRFYELVLGESMTYSCAVFENPDTALAAAQEAKHDLVARKLGLRPGMRLLDVGCGWGGMVRHAARHYGVTAVGITLSPQQAAWARGAVSAEGLSDQVEIVETDYRTAPGGPYDAISSIGMVEHVGIRRYPRYFATLHGLLVPGGRLLNHGITRADSRASAFPGAFVDRYVFPDGELPSLGRIVAATHDAGLEVRHSETLREHYALTLTAWTANLVRHWDEAVAEVGQARARVWGLYMAGSRMSFEEGSLQVHQVLSVRGDAEGGSRLPLRPDWT